MGFVDWLKGHRAGVQDPQDGQNKLQTTLRATYSALPTEALEQLLAKPSDLVTGAEALIHEELERRWTALTDQEKSEITANRNATEQRRRRILEERTHAEQMKQQKRLAKADFPRQFTEVCYVQFLKDGSRHSSSTSSSTSYRLMMPPVCASCGESLPTVHASRTLTYEMRDVGILSGTTSVHKKTVDVPLCEYCSQNNRSKDGFKRPRLYLSNAHIHGVHTVFAKAFLELNERAAGMGLY